MKTIELNTWTSLLLACIVAGVGSILPSFFNLAGYISGIVYTIVAVVIMTTYRRKLWFRVNDVNIEPKIEQTLRNEDISCQMTPYRVFPKNKTNSDIEDKLRKLKEMNEDGGL